MMVRDCTPVTGSGAVALRPSYLSRRFLAFPPILNLSAKFHLGLLEIAEPGRVFCVSVR